MKVGTWELQHEAHLRVQVDQDPQLLLDQSTSCDLQSSPRKRIRTWILHQIMRILTWEVEVRTRCSGPRLRPSTRVLDVPEVQVNLHLDVQTHGDEQVLQLPLLDKTNITTDIKNPEV